MVPLLIDENLNQRILRGLKLVVPLLNYVVAQNAGLKGISDPQVLAWAAEHNRVLVTHDVSTIPKHAFRRVAAGLPMPGVITVPESLGIGQAISDLQLVVECCQENELQNLVLFMPL